MDTTIIFSKNLKAYNDEKRFIINQGGTSSGKTWAILQLLYLIAVNRQGILISIVSETLPHLKKGAMRDLQVILEKIGAYNDEMHNKSTNSFIIGKSTIEFFSADNSGKVRGPRRDILYINECNNVYRETFDQLAIRTREVIFLDYNPTGEFYVHSDIFGRKDVSYEFIKSTYRDNHLLEPVLVKEIERRKETDPNWWKVYGEGELGMLEGVVFNNWSTCDEMPETPRRVIGVDFGFTNDPTAIVDVRYQNGEIWIDELIYETGLTNQNIANFLKQEEINKVVTVCDSAEPKSIYELTLNGVRAIPCVKGTDSVRNGIDLMKQYKINVSKRSVNVIKELRNYRWKVDRDGKPLNVPVDIYNHAIDSIRYAVSHLVGAENKSVKSRIILPK
jgi:phage terminase large subunit